MRRTTSTVVLFLDRLDADRRKQAMKEIRAAQWYNPDAPPVVKSARTAVRAAVRLVFAGTPAVACPPSTPSQPRRTSSSRSSPGRRAVGRAPAAALAGEHVGDERGIPVLTPATARTEFLQKLADLKPDCAPVVAYGALVPPAALDIPRTAGSTCTSRCCPPGAARRRAACGAARRRADRASVFLLEEGLDTGPCSGR
jgi:methionyl-tRNA formyltransferase